MKRRELIFLVVTAITLVWTLNAMAEPSIKIGCVNPLSGRVAFAGIPSKNTVNMMAEELNKAGGINGVPIEIIHYDTEGKEDVTVRIFNRLIQKDNVTAIIGPIESWVATAVIPIIEKHEIPTILHASSSSLVKPVRKWVFKTAAGDDLVLDKMLSHMKSTNVERVALISSQDSFGEGGREAVLSLAKNYGLNIIFEERFAGDETDLTPLLNKVKKTDAQAVIAWSSKRTPNVVTINYRQLAIEKPLYISHAALGPDYLNGVGKHAEGVFTASSKFAGATELPDSDPNKKVILEYRDAYKKKFQEEANQFSAGAFDAFNIMAAALKQGAGDKGKIRDAIENTKGYVGTYGIFNYGPDDHAGLTKDAIVMYQVVDGAWKPIK
ncbi:MAG: ABC transporter substrate-binding protein [Thermodesulfobacteriota bacterium]